MTNSQYDMKTYQGQIGAIRDSARKFVDSGLKEHDWIPRMEEVMCRRNSFIQNYQKFSREEKSDIHQSYQILDDLISDSSLISNLRSYEKVFKT